jgi:predicted  nucleic acid-binding Zn-ribbon protein
MEIFKGCSTCKGKRFFYTEEPISEKERKELTDRADKDIKELIKDLLTQRRQHDLQTGGLPDTGEGWVKVDRDKKVKPVDLKTIRDPKVSLTHLGSPAEVKSKLQQILDEELGRDSQVRAGPRHKPAPDKKMEPKPEREKKIEAEKPEAEPAAAELAGREAPAEPKPSKKPRKERKKGVKKPAVEKRPEVITIVEPGVYEIDVERLLDHGPIIILKDGTYLLHLPSLLKKPDEK